MSADQEQVSLHGRRVSGSEFQQTTFSEEFAGRVDHLLLSEHLINLQEPFQVLLQPHYRKHFSLVSTDEWRLMLRERTALWMALFEWMAAMEMASKDSVKRKKTMKGGNNSEHEENNTRDGHFVTQPNCCKQSFHSN